MASPEECLSQVLAFDPETLVLRCTRHVDFSVRWEENSDLSLGDLNSAWDRHVAMVAQFQGDTKLLVSTLQGIPF